MPLPDDFWEEAVEEPLFRELPPVWGASPLEPGFLDGCIKTLVGTNPCAEIVLSELVRTLAVPRDLLGFDDAAP